MSIDVSFDKVDNPHPADQHQGQGPAPNGECNGHREEALRRVAAHCPVHETIETVDHIDFEFVDRMAMAAD
jgi:hypothetical protein